MKCITRNILNQQAYQAYNMGMNKNFSNKKCRKIRRKKVEQIYGIRHSAVGSTMLCERDTKLWQIADKRRENKCHKGNFEMR